MTGTGVQPVGEPPLSAEAAAVDVAATPIVFFIMKSARRRVWDRKRSDGAHGVQLSDLCASIGEDFQRLWYVMGCGIVRQDKSV